MAEQGVLRVSRVLTRREAAAWLAVSQRTLERLAKIGDGPPMVRVGVRGLRYPIDGLTAWLGGRT